MRQLIRWLRANPPPRFTSHESYFDKLLRYIPADIVAGWVAIDGLIRDQASDPVNLYWIVFAFMVVLTPLHICFIKTQPPGFLPSKVFPATVGVLAFIVWVFALGGPFAVTFADWYRPLFGSIALILTTLTIPILESIIYKDNDPHPE